MHIRGARPSDAAELMRLNEAFNGPGTSAADEIARALAEEGDELVSVAEAGGHLAGFVCGRVFRSFCYPDSYAEVTELYVDPACRRTGVARALMAHMEGRLRAMGAVEIHLYTGADNRAAQAFYERMGYEPSTEIEYRKHPRRKDDNQWIERSAGDI